jgi:hypothetical protein
MRIEQAIFTSVQSGRLNGYQLAATSSGITPEQAKELTVWGPAHDSLWDTRPTARSINFHPLADGQFCLSCTTLAGAEYSGRGGGRVYTQMFVLPGEALASFSNDPFLVLRALSTSGRLAVLDRVPQTLSGVPLVGRGSQVTDLRQTIVEEIGENIFDQLSAAVVQHQRVAVVTSGDVERLFQALLHALPENRRLSISFTTGLKDSPRRPFQLFVVPSDPAIVRQTQRATAATMIDVAGRPAESLIGCH